MSLDGHDRRGRSYEELGVPDELQLEIEGWEGIDNDRLLSALEDAGWSTDKVAILGRLVATWQDPGMYYAGVLRPVGERRWEIALRRVEE